MKLRLGFLGGIFRSSRNSASNLPPVETKKIAGRPGCEHHLHFEWFKALHPCGTKARMLKITCCKCTLEEVAIKEDVW